MPGVGIKYTWKLEEAINLDENDDFIKELEEKINMVLIALNKHIIFGKTW